MRLTPRQINAFRAVMLTGSMTGASQFIGLTQPAVSRLIRDLELTIGLVLFERRGNQLVPTSEAVALLGEVERSFVGLDRIAEFAQALRSQSAGSLRVAAMPALAGGALPRFVASFMRAHPDLHVTVLGMPSPLVVESVAAGQADFGYATGPLDRPGFDLEVQSAPAVAIVPQGHALAAKRVIDPQDFAGERFIGLAAGSLLRARIDAALADVSRPVVVETPLAHVACILVCEGVGVSVVDPCAADEYVNRGLVIRPLSVAIEVGYVFIRPRQRTLSTLASQFISEFSAHLQRTIKAHTSGMPNGS